MFSARAADPHRFCRKDTDPSQAIRAALEVLGRSIDRAYDDDLHRDDEMNAALDYLHLHLIRKAPVEAFRTAFNICDPSKRCICLKDAYDRICVGLGKLAPENCNQSRFLNP